MKKLLALALGFLMVVPLASCKESYHSDDENIKVITSAEITEQTQPLNGKDETEDGPYSEETQDESPVINKTPIRATITHAREFQDGYAVVSFEQNQKHYGAIIDTNGIIRYRAEIASLPAVDNMVDYWCRIDENVYVVYYKSGAEDHSALVNVDGEVVASSEKGDFDRIMTTGDKLAIVCKKELDGVNYRQYIGAIDANGTLVNEWTEIDNLLVTTWSLGLKGSEYIGEGLYKIHTHYGLSDSHLIFQPQSGKIIFNGQISEATLFVNGAAMIRVNYIFDGTEPVEYINGWLKLRLDGSYEEISYADVLKSSQIQLPYDQTAIENVYKFSNFTVVTMYTSADGMTRDYFWMVLDENGTELVKPVPMYSTNDVFASYDFYASEETIIYATEMGDMYYKGTYPSYHVVNPTTGENLADITNKFQFLGSYSDGLAPAYTRDGITKTYSYFYVDMQGNTVIDGLYQ